MVGGTIVNSAYQKGDRIPEELITGKEYGPLRSGNNTFRVKNH
jgi:hypothetical protein